MDGLSRLFCGLVHEEEEKKVLSNRLGAHESDDVIHLLLAAIIPSGDVILQCCLQSFLNDS